MKKKYEIVRLCSQEELSVFDGLYSGLHVDPYVKEGFRFKNIMRVRVSEGTFIKGPHEPLFQSKKYNPVHGDIMREYPEIPEEYRNSLLTKAVLTYAQECGIGYDKEILVQAQRIKCSKSLVGFPAVEGPHQDGKEFVAIFCVARENVQGGVSEISIDQGNDILSTVTLEPGQMLVIDDKKYFHYATPIKCVDEDIDGFRDIFIFSTPSSRPSEILY